MNPNGILPKNFYKIVSKIIANKNYGSVEIYFEKGAVVQITQRIINKVTGSR